MTQKNNSVNQVWFTSDCHFSHKNILKHCPERANAGGFDVSDVESHDKWLIDRWNKTIAKKDIVYIIGDFAFGSPDNVKKILGKLNGKKFLILGNHDKSSEHLDNYFEQITQMKLVNFKQCNYSFLTENLKVFMCHYPMVTWPEKHYGCIEAHGHSHGSLDEYNEETPDLRVDIGLDGKLADFSFVSLEQLYKYFKNKTEGKDFREYAQEKKEKKTMLC